MAELMSKTIPEHICLKEPMKMDDPLCKLLTNCMLLIGLLVMKLAFGEPYA